MTLEVPQYQETHTLDDDLNSMLQDEITENVHKSITVNSSNIVSAFYCCSHPLQDIY